MRKVIVLLFILSVTSVWCKGLREGFTWTRINYDWNSLSGDGTSTRSRRSPAEDEGTNTTLSSRQGKSPYQGGNKPQTPTVEDIMFPEDNREIPVTSGSSGDGLGGEANPNVPYIFENNIPMGANLWRNKLFITVPRRRLGVPSTLNFIWTNSTQKHNLPLIPYPNWQTNLIDNSTPTTTNLVSTYRIAVDSCNRLWAPDTGTIETLGNPTQLKPSEVIIFDLITDQIIRRHAFESNVMRPATSLASVTVDIPDARNCEDAFGYFPDLSGYGLIVYSLREDRAWRLSHNFFYLEPMAGDLRIGGFNFQWNDGIFSIAIGETKPSGYRDAYFHSMAGTHLYSVSTRILRNESLATRSFHGNDFKVVGDRGHGSQTSSSALHQGTGVLFLNLVTQNAVACWNTQHPLRDISIVQKDDHRMIYPSDIKVHGNHLLVLTNTMPVFLYGQLNYDQTNFRVWLENISRAIEGTKCKNSKNNKRRRHN